MTTKNDGVRQLKEGIRKAERSKRITCGTRARVVHTSEYLRVRNGGSVEVRLGGYGLGR
jgi:hypothetical protein